MIREAVANALAHRDYAAPGHVQVRIFTDRVEVISPGALHFGLTPADLYVPHISRPWNVLILGAMYRRGLVDQLGSGTLRIARLCAQKGLGRPILAATTSSVTCTLPRQGFWITADGRSVAVSDVDTAALRLLAAGPQQRGDFVDQLNLSERGVRDLLDRLKEHEQAHLVGHGRGARWTLGPS